MNTDAAEHICMAVGQLLHGSSVVGIDPDTEKLADTAAASCIQQRIKGAVVGR